MFVTVIVWVALVEPTGICPNDMNEGVCVERVDTVKVMRTRFDSVVEVPNVPPAGTVLEPPPPPPPYE